MALSAIPNVENLIYNGDFSKGTDGWSNKRSDYFITSDNEASFLGNTQFALIESGTTIANHVYYCRASVKSDSNAVRLMLLYGANITHSGSGNYEVLSLCKIVTNGSTYALKVEDVNTTGFTEIRVKNVLMIDLTETFGKGNEPTVEECDRIFADWFDGAKYLPQLASAVKEPEKNLLPFAVGSITYNGITLTIDTEGLITINGTATTTVAIKLTKELVSAANYSYLANGENLFMFKNTMYTLSLTHVSGSCSGSLYFNCSDGTGTNLCGSVSFNKLITQQNIGGKYFSYAWFYGGNGSVFDNLKVKLQLEEGDTATSYSPYKEVSKRAELVPVGNNICPTTADAWVQGNMYSSDGYVYNDVTRLRSIDAIEFKPNTEYTLSIQNGYSLIIIGVSGGLVTGWNTNATFNSYEHRLVRALIKRSDDGVILPSEVEQAKPQIEEGVISTTFSPYQLAPKQPQGIKRSDIVLRELPNGVKDSIVMGNELVQKCNEYTLQESDYLGYSSTTGQPYVDYIMYTPPSDCADLGASSSITGQTLILGTTESRYSAPIPASEIGKYFTYTSGGLTRLCFIFEKGTTLEQAKNYVAGTKITYQLAQEVKHDIYPKLAVGAINLWAEAGKPTEYNPLPVGVANFIYIGVGDFKVTFEAKSPTYARLDFRDTSAEGGIENHNMFNLTPEFKKYEVHFMNSCWQSYFFIDADSVGDIEIKDIKLTIDR